MSLLFIDTNVWLNFYSAQKDAGIGLVKLLPQIKSNLITSCQVEMEFKKNRQTAILAAVGAMKSPEPAPTPAVLRKAKASKELSDIQKQTKKLIVDIKKQLNDLLTDPLLDPIYQVFDECFDQESELALTRETTTRSSVKKRAYKRFLYGYPPRKHNDTSIGDAMNWEWIIDCAQKKHCDVHIVSFDRDYGITLDGKCYVNDFLKQEFTERVNKRKVHLHESLAPVLRDVFKLKVTKEQESAEAASTEYQGTLGREVRKFLSINRGTVREPFSSLVSQSWVIPQGELKKYLEGTSED